jgi:hypothetical protein
VGNLSSFFGVFILLDGSLEHGRFTTFLEEVLVI